MEGNKYSSAAFLGVLTRELATHLYKKQFQLTQLVQLLQKASQLLMCFEIEWQISLHHCHLWAFAARAWYYNYATTLPAYEF